MKLAYLASPYSDPDPTIREARFAAVAKEARSLIENLNPPHNFRLVVYSPIFHWHSIANKFGLPVDAEYWRQCNEEVLSRCDELIILMLDGWSESVGIKAEIDFAKKHSISTWYKHPQEESEAFHLRPFAEKSTK